MLHDVELAELQKHWERFGEDDPLWAIITAPDRRHGKWDVKEFFYSGLVEIERVFDIVGRIIPPTSRPHGRALDFGCGVGRATQALCSRYDHVDGVDIAEPMIEHARRYNAYGDRCAYHVNTEPNLRLFDDATFDLVYTAHVLQHMHPRHAEGYVREFFRVLKPEGIAVFEIPTGRVATGVQPLPDTAFAAEIEILESPKELGAGEHGTVSVRVRNQSPVAWPAVGTPDGWYHVTAGNHWRGRWGRPSQLDDGRAHFPYDIAPGASIELTLPVTAPAQAGAYTLEVDLVQEGVSWFAPKGSRVAGTSVRVRDRGGAAPAPRDPASAEHVEPVMEMYGTRDETIRDWVRHGGGAVIDTFDWDEISREKSLDWRRVGYVARREPAARAAVQAIR